MKRKYIIAAVLATFIVGAGAFAYINANKSTANVVSSETTNEEAIALQKKNDTNDAAMKKAEAAKVAPSNAPVSTSPTAAVPTDDTAVKGSFSDYSNAKLANAQKGNVVLFFSAPWCPTCREANKNFTSSATPDGLTLLKVDYDSSTDLKKKYGVTLQHTYVKVDKDGNLIKKWSGSTNYDQIKSQLN